jgi:VanZ family protein
VSGRLQRKSVEGVGLRVLPAAFYALLLFVGGSIPSDGGGSSVSDKWLHFIGFMPMAVLSERAISALYPALKPRLRLLSGAAVSSGIGVLLELWQLALPYRSAEIADWVADTLGSLLAVALVAVYRRAQVAR